MIRRCRRGGRAAGGSAAEPSPPSPDKCCKLDESAPARQSEGNIKPALFLSLSIAYNVPFNYSTAETVLWSPWRHFRRPEHEAILLLPAGWLLSSVL